MRRCLVLALTLLLTVTFSIAQNESLEHYLLMKKIENAINNGDFVVFKEICENKISVNFDPPFELHGYVYIDKFIDDFTRKFFQYETQKIEWVSKQLEEQFAVQSLTLILKNKQSEKTVYYKFIFFLAKKDEEWKIYYLRGLKI